MRPVVWLDSFCMSHVNGFPTDIFHKVYSVQ